MVKAENTEEYIANAAEFAQPILRHIRQTVLNTVPGIEEQIKWLFPCFMYKGKILCHMAAFKAHCSFGFWLAPIMDDPYSVMEARGENSAMGQFGKIGSLDDLPTVEILKAYLLEAAQLIDQGKTLPKNPKPKKTFSMPPSFKKALEAEPKALNIYQGLSSSHQHEYLEYICEAKQEATQVRRIVKSINLLLEGNSLNAKYSK